MQKKYDEAVRQWELADTPLAHHFIGLDLASQNNILALKHFQIADAAGIPDSRDYLRRRYGERAERLLHPGEPDVNLAPPKRSLVPLLVGLLLAGGLLIVVLIWLFRK